MFITNDNILIPIFMGYSLISFILSIFLSCGFVEENINPFKDAIVAIKEIETIGDLIDVLLEIPEYQEAKRRGAGPKIFAGDPSHKMGKFIVEMTD